VIFLLINTGCSKLNQEKIAIKVDDYTLTIDEFNELFNELNLTEDTPQMRKLFIENLINGIITMLS